MNQQCNRQSWYLMSLYMRHYTLHTPVSPPRCQSQAWIKEEGNGKSLCCSKTAQYLPIEQYVVQLPWIRNFGWLYDMCAYISYTTKRRVYVFVCLFVCLFSLSAKRLTNRLMQTRKIGNDCRVNFSWSSEHIFNFLHFVIQKLRGF